MYTTCVGRMRSRCSFGQFTRYNSCLAFQTFKFVHQVLVPETRSVHTWYRFVFLVSLVQDNRCELFILQVHVVGTLPIICPTIFCTRKSLPVALGFGLVGSCSLILECEPFCLAQVVAKCTQRVFLLSLQYKY